MKEMFEELLGPQTTEILVDTLQRRAEVMLPTEIEAVNRLAAGQPLTEMDKLSLNELVMAMADDFGTRRRIQELQRAMQQIYSRPEEEEEEEWLPSEPEEILGGPDGQVGDSMAKMLEELKSDFDLPSEEDFESF